MRTYLVVVAPPRLDNDFRFGTRTKPFQAQTLIAKLAVETFRDSILPRLAGLDQCGAEPVRRLEAFTGAGRRRTWTAEQKAQILAESESGEKVSAVAQSYRRLHGAQHSQAGSE